MTAGLVPPPHEEHGGTSPGSTSRGTAIQKRASSSIPRLAGDVHVLRWPDEQHLLHALEATGAPRLLLVAPGEAPPLVGDCCQDWMWQTGKPAELRARAQQLSQRAFAHHRTRPTVDRDGLLRAGLRSIALTPREGPIATLLAERFDAPVPVEDLLAAGWPAASVNDHTLATLIARLRRRVAPLGLDITNVRREGYILGLSAAAQPPILTTGYWDEIDADAWLSRTPRRQG